MDRERDHRHVDQAEEDEAGVVNVDEAMHLEDDEQGEHDHGGRVGPQLLEQQSDGEREVQRAVAEEEPDVIMMLAGVEVPRDPFVAVPAVEQAEDRVGAEQSQRDPADYLDQAVQPFQGDGDLEDLVDALFLHSQVSQRAEIRFRSSA